MTNDLYTFISATFGVSAAVALAIMGLALWLTHYITKRTTEIKSRHEQLDKGAAKMESNIDEIRKDMAFVKGFMESLQKSVTDGYTQKHSPVSLTELGKKEVENSKLNDIVARNWVKISMAVEEGAQSQSPYDIQSYCMETAYVTPEMFFEPSDISYIKELAFRKGLALMTYTNMLGVLIRDRYLKEKNLE